MNTGWFEQGPAEEREFFEGRARREALAEADEREHADRFDCDDDCPPDGRDA